MSAFFRQHWYTLALPATAAFAYWQPEWFRSGGRLHYEQYKELAIGGMFLAAGLSMPRITGISQYFTAKNILDHTLIQGFSLLLIPAFLAATAPTMVRTLGLPQETATGIIFLGCLPTTLGVCVVLTKLSGGSAPLAVLHSALGNLLGPFVVPITSAYFSGVYPEINGSDLFSKVAALIVLPTMLGLSARILLPQVVEMFGAYYTTIQQALLLSLLANVLSNGFAHPNEQGASLANCAVVAGLMLGLHALFFTSAWALFGFRGMTYENRIAASFVASQKTAVVGLPMLALCFQGSPHLFLLALPLLCYHPMQLAFGTVGVPNILRAIPCGISYQ